MPTCPKNYATVHGPCFIRVDPCNPWFLFAVWGGYPTRRPPQALGWDHFDAGQFAVVLHLPVDSPADEQLVEAEAVARIVFVVDH